MNDLGTFLFAIAISCLVGYCLGHVHRSHHTANRTFNRPQRTPRSPWS